MFYSTKAIFFEFTSRVIFTSQYHPSIIVRGTLDLKFRVLTKVETIMCGCMPQVTHGVCMCRVIRWGMYASCHTLGYIPQCDIGVCTPICDMTRHVTHWGMYASCHTLGYIPQCDIGVCTPMCDMTRHVTHWGMYALYHTWGIYVKPKPGVATGQ